jgi:release factor glutamine methyltransferase
MMIGEALMAAQSQLARVSDSPRLDAELLLEHVTGFSRSQILTRLQQAFDDTQQAEFQILVGRRLRQEPVAYLTGEKGFWTLNLKVSPAVLVPRPETELLVEWALELLKTLPAARVGDLGTGSGAIALALASECPRAELVAVEISEDALAIARENAHINDIENVKFVCASFAEFLMAAPDQPYDLLVSNPPYIARNDAHLDALHHEPLMALTDGADGLQALREIIAGASAHLKPQGWLLLEHGYDQGEAVRALLHQHGYADAQTRRDLGGHERATGARKP